MVSGTYYVEGRAGILGNQGSLLNPLQVTVIAEGSIDVEGNTHLAPHYPGLLFVTDGGSSCYRQLLRRHRGRPDARS